MSLISSLGVICSVYYFSSVAPFGRNSLLAIDFFHQYGPMMGELYDRVKNGMNFIYSFNMGMGLPFFTNFFNYMSSLFNILLFFVKRSDLLTTYSVIIGLKVSFSSVAMAILLNKKMDSKKSMIPALSLLYAFNNYFVAYYWNIMWLDVLVFLPLVVLGIERLVDNRKILLYVLSLSLMLFSNYFMGFMICIFSVIYFLVYSFFLSKLDFKKDFINRGFLFGICSLIAGGLVAFALIPLFSSLSSISATSDAWPSSQYYSFSIWEFIYYHIGGVRTTVLKSYGITAPNISSSIIVLPLYFLFLLNKNISKKKKIGYSLLLFVLILSFFWAPLDFLWHAFHVPNDLPYRYSFLYPFVLIIISGLSIKNIDYVKDYSVILIFILMMTFLVSTYIFDFVDFKDKIIVMNFIVLIIWFLCFIIYTFFNKLKLIIPYILIITVSLELVIGINNNWNISQDMDSFYKSDNDVSEALSYIRSNDNDKFYRIEKTPVHTFNDPSWYNYYGITAFSSMEYENLAFLHHLLGMPGNSINSFYYGSNSPIFNIIFDLRYLLTNDADNFYSLIYSDDKNDNYVYKFNYNTSLMYKVDSEILNWDYLNNNPFEIQNDFIYKSMGISDVLYKPLVPYEIFSDDDYTYYKFKYNFNGYLYINDSISSVLIDERMYYKSSSSILIPFGYIGSEELTDKNILYLDNVDEVTVAFNKGYEPVFDYYEVDYDKMSIVSNYVLDNQVNIVDFSEDNIKLSYKGRAGLIFTSIPYDEGWNIYVNGVKTDKFMVGNSLICFNVQDGDNLIEFKYSIPHLEFSLIISFISLVGIVVLNSKIKKIG